MTKRMPTRWTQAQVEANNQARNTPRPRGRKGTAEAPLSVAAAWGIYDVKEALAWEAYEATVKAAWAEASSASGGGRRNNGGELIQ